MCDSFGEQRRDVIDGELALWVLRGGPELCRGEEGSNEGMTGMGEDCKGWKQVSTGVEARKRNEHAWIQPPDIGDDDGNKMDKAITVLDDVGWKYHWKERASDRLAQVSLMIQNPQAIQRLEAIRRPRYD